jgi:hypothetical protein
MLPRLLIRERADTTLLFARGEAEWLAEHVMRLHPKTRSDKIK